MWTTPSSIWTNSERADSLNQRNKLDSAMNNINSSILDRRSAEAEAKHRTTMHQIAALIVEPPPRWLSEFLYDWSFEIKSLHSIETMWPARAEMKARLRKMNKLADDLAKLLEDSVNEGFLVSYSSVGSDSAFRNLREGLVQLRSHVREAMKSPQLVDKNGKLIKGRGKVSIPNNIQPEYACAIIVHEIFELLYSSSRKRPPKRVMWSAAHQLWESWFESDSWGNDKPTRWKDYFKALESPRLQAFRNDIRMNLRNRAHMHALLEEEN